MQHQYQDIGGHQGLEAWRRSSVVSSLSGSAARLAQIQLKIENSERHEARQHLLLSPLTPKQSTFTAPKLLIWCILVLAVDLELKHAHQFELLELLVDVVQHGGEQDPSRPCPWSPCLSLACDPLVT